MATRLQDGRTGLFGWPWLRLVTGLIFFGLGCFMTGAMDNAWGATTFSYVDDQGTVVFTDKRENIPERYRSRVKVVEGGESSKVDSTGATVKQATDRAKDMVSRFTPTIPGLSPDQSQVLTMAFAAAVLMFAVMMLSGNKAVQLLMRWLLVLLAIGTTATMYFSQGDLTEKAKGAAKELERTQQQKAQQLHQMEPTEKSP
ncbi:MAG: hypothetical protein HY581_06870 [Nitrospirae bacterium]|nr:hypothetical protein [Nitrospirota bacterium]